MKQFSFRFFLPLALSTLLLSSATSVAEEQIVPISAIELHVALPEVENTEKLTETKRKLFIQAFDTATKITPNPHHKTRGRRQEEVLDALIKNGQLGTAFDLAYKIDNWRRGVSFAKIGYQLALDGKAEAAEKLLGLANDEALKTEDWRRDRIFIKIAQAHTILGNADTARKYNHIEIGASEKGKVFEAEFLKQNEDTINDFLEMISRSIDETTPFDQRANVIDSYLLILDEYYEAQSLRTQLVDTIYKQVALIPAYKQFHIKLRMVEIAVENNDFEQARKLMENLQLYLGPDVGWELRNRIELTARAGAGWYIAGEEEKGKALIDDAIEQFNEENELIVDFWRGVALRPIAESYMKIGDKEKAAKVYSMALNEGNKNVNARPRANDLVAHLLSMAESDFSPDEKTWDQIRKIHEGLKAPW